ncbi:MAG: methyl-accepting chemotaxis protein, partial [bacterium]|nr:methyl-accepting chemotaxis protein [bacterium]
KQKGENDQAVFQDLEALEKEFDAYYRLGKKMAQTYLENGLDAGNGVMEVFDRSAVTLTEKIAVLKGKQREAAKSGMANIVRVSRKVQKLNTIMGIIVLLVTTIIAVSITRGVTQPIKEAIKLVEAVAEGDLPATVKIRRQDEIGRLLSAMKRMIAKLRQIAGELTQASESMASHAEEVSAATSQIAAGVVQQVQDIDQSAAATTEMSQTLQDVAKSTVTATKTAQTSVDSAKEGKAIVETSVSDISLVAATVEESAKTITDLGKSSKEIGDIIKVINDIADQTNLLALNAAIEAARAGDQGRGFAVVADEVRKLAEKTGHATRGISETIETIQEKTEISVRTMKEGSLKATAGVQSIQRARESLARIVESSEQSLAIFNSIAAATEQQSAVTEQLSNNLDNIALVSRGSQDVTRQISNATNELASLAGNLNARVQWFKLQSALGVTSTFHPDKTEQSSDRSDGKCMGQTDAPPLVG